MLIATLATALFMVLGGFIALGPAQAAEMDEAALTAAVAAAAPGDTVAIPAGVITLTQPLKVPTGVSLAGAGRDSTILRLSRTNWSNFSYAYMITPATASGAGASGVTISGLTIDGNRTNHDSTATPDSVDENAGGGIKLGDGWTVSDVRLTNVNYYPIWILGVGGTTVTNCVIDGDNGSTGAKDNIGGGRANDVTIAGNTFASTARGNAVDIIRSSNLTIRDNVIAGTATREHNIYLEGVTGGTVSGNTLTYAAVSLKSDAAYAGTTTAINPEGITVSNNTITTPKTTGVSITYSTGTTSLLLGGNNRIEANTITAAGLSGVVIIHCVPNATKGPDSIVGNTISDPFTRGDSKWGTGCGTVQSSGISITAGTGTTITGNRITDTRSTAIMAYGIYAGAERAKAALVGLAAADNTVAGALIGVQPFDQPNVQESKTLTAALLRQAIDAGHPPALASQGDLASLLSLARPGDYFAMMAYLEDSPPIDRALQALRLALLDRFRLATTLGYGPRFLHSTGQYHKGGPPTGLFIQLTADPAVDLPVPGEAYSFATLVAAQAEGDLQALTQRGRRAIRIALGADPSREITRLAALVRAA
jgi:hypothetical protein